MLTRFEIARVIGLRALQLAEGHEASVHIADATLRCDHVYVAGCELYDRRLDMCVTRDGKPVHVNDLRFPIDLSSMLNARDGGDRPPYDLNR